MNQANFVGEKIDEPNSFYKKMIQNNQLVVFSTISYNHVFIYRFTVSSAFLDSRRQIRSSSSEYHLVNVALRPRLRKQKNGRDER